MTDSTENKAKIPAAGSQQDVAHASDGKAEATGAAKPSGELSEDDLEAVAGGVTMNFLDLVVSPIMGSLGYQPPSN